MQRERERERRRGHHHRHHHGRRRVIGHRRRPGRQGEVSQAHGPPQGRPAGLGTRAGSPTGRRSGMPCPRCRGRHPEASAPAGSGAKRTLQGDPRKARRHGSRGTRSHEGGRKPGQQGRRTGGKEERWLRKHQYHRHQSVGAGRRRKRGTHAHGHHGLDGGAACNMAGAMPRRGSGEKQGAGELTAQEEEKSNCERQGQGTNRRLVDGVA